MAHFGHKNLFVVVTIIGSPCNKQKNCLKIYMSVFYIKINGNKRGKNLAEGLIWG